MDRKKIIISAVCVNAVLLVLLFITAMTTKDEPSSQRAGIAQLQAPEIIEIPEEPPSLAVGPPPAPLFVLPQQKDEKPTAVETPVVIAKAPPPAGLPQQSAALEVEVHKGDTLEKIAKAYHTRVDLIIKLNQLPSSFLKVGQKLKIPSEKTLDLPVLRESLEYYVMKVGDNPWSIAMKHHIKVDELLKLNGLNEKSARKLKPGDRLRIK